MAFVQKKHRGTQAVLHSAVEALEVRQMLSGGSASLASIKAVPDAKPSAGAAFLGYSPTQIRAAYGFSSITETGAGQTIAIVDAFDDVNIQSDLHAFDQKYGLSDPTLNVLDQGGGTSGLDPMNYDAGWAVETSLDVEWAHAVAPGATIDLILTEDDSMENLLAGAATGASLPGVSAVSMSFGSVEFNQEQSLDRDLMTPIGHQGVTFIASSGDSGMTGSGYPATSPYVLSVGGTTLNLTTGGAYNGEAAWDGSVGGESMFEPTPAYQSNVMIAAHRTVPDVSYDADPGSGVNVVVSQPNLLGPGFTQENFAVGGTSAGAPQWAGLIADVNQERVANGLTTLNGVDQTLPALYSLYGARRHTAAYSIYHTNFNDVTTGTSLAAWEINGEPLLGIPEYSSKTEWDGGFTGYAATSGYDMVTGLGTPQAASLIPTLASYDPPVVTARRHRAAATVTPAVTTSMSRAALRRLQAALATSVKPAVERLGEQTSVVTDSASPAPVSHPTLTTAPMAGLPATMASELAHPITNDGASRTLAFTSSVEPALVTSTGLGVAEGIAPRTLNYSGYNISTPPTPATSLAAIPGVAVANLETLLQSSAATTYSSSLQLVRMDTVTELADAVSMFVKQAGSAMLPDMKGMTQGTNMPVAVIVGVLAADAVLLGRTLRRRRWTLDRGWVQSAYALADVPDDE
jgi:hypothetical protein